MQGFFAALDASLPAIEPAAILEVGVGEGEISARLRDRYPSARLVGIDLPDSELGSAWSERELACGFADIVDLPFPAGSFDLVLAIEVLEHVPDPHGALRELARVGTGAFVLSVPREPVWRVANVARGKYVRDLGNTPGHIQHWSKRQFGDLVARHLDVQHVRSPFPWTMVAASR